MADAPNRLTLTWDVFKYYKLVKEEYVKDRLTLTWDVFKCSYIS